MFLYRWIRGSFQSLFRKPQLDRELDEELRSVLTMMVEEKIRAGMDPADALRQARGGLDHPGNPLVVAVPTLNPAGVPPPAGDQAGLTPADVTLRTTPPDSFGGPLPEDQSHRKKEVVLPVSVFQDRSADVVGEFHVPLQDANVPIEPRA